MLSLFAKKRNFRHCYTGGYNGVDTLVKTRGYYSTGWEQQKHLSFFLYDDGFLVYASFPEPGFGFDSKGNIVEIEMRDVQLLNQVYHSGNYTIVQDTIKMQFSSTPYQMNIGYKPCLWYKITDSLTLEYVKPDFVQKGWTPHCVQFQSLDKLPNPNVSWLKWEKWFWCDKEKYRSWKKSLKK